MSPHSPERGDRLPLWVIALLIFFIALRVLDLYHLGGVKKGGRLSQSLTGQVNARTMQTTISVNWLAKVAYVRSFENPDLAINPNAAELREALESAEELQSETGNSPSAARRVLILRALLRKPPLAVGKNGLSTMDAFNPQSLAALSSEDRRVYSQEGALWKAVLSGQPLSPIQIHTYADQLRAAPNIRWWLSPALTTLYRSQGNLPEAEKYARQARFEALVTLGPMLLVNLLLLALGLGGVILLAALLLAKRRKKNADDSVSSLWPVMRQTVPIAERRLRAGDLMGVFVLYLLMPDLLGWLLGGFGIPHHFYFRGLLTHWRHSLIGLPASSHIAAVVLLEFFAYLLGAAIPIFLLIVLARRRRASIREELGWNLHRFGPNLLYGVGGYAIALPLVLVASLAGRTIHAPDPSNPAIPLLAGASSVWVQVMLIVLATIAAPLTEELLFRGVFYNAAKMRVGVWPAIALTGLVFGFAHPVGIAEMLPLAVLGGVFAWLAETRQSLVPSMVAHFLQNSLATAMLLLALGG